MSLKLKNHCKDKSFNRHLQISHSDNIKKTWERCSRTTPTNVKSHFRTHIKYQNTKLYKEKKNYLSIVTT